VITRIGYQLPTLVGGAVIMENIFGVPGLGQLLLTTLTERDYPVVTGLLLIGALAIVVANLLADLAYGVVDPRIRFQ
jgi:peptide/nickel transport system permease protein